MYVDYIMIYFVKSSLYHIYYHWPANHRSPGLITQPEFHLIQQRRDHNRIVLILDTSGSMNAIPGVVKTMEATHINDKLLSYFEILNYI